MGADGHIIIWRDDKVREQFPDCDELFRLLPTHYTDHLDGVKYHHCYWGDNLPVDWESEDDWYIFSHPDRDHLEVRLREFCNWLSKNGTSWEVWT